MVARAHWPMCASAESHREGNGRETAKKGGEVVCAGGAG